MKLNEEIDLVKRRCFDCGRFWALERFVAGDVTCPLCGGEKIRRAQAEVDRLERSNRSLRAARTRSKARTK